MNQFVAPQFIDVEDRIIGPITTRQFVMMVIGGIIVFLAYKFLETSYFVLIGLIVSVIVVVFGFVKINGRYFASFVKSMIETIKRPRVRVWYKYVPLSQVSLKSQENEKVVKSDFIPRRKKIQPRHLSELALLVDTGGRFSG